MSQLSSPESTLKKLNSLYEKIEGLYRLVDQIQAIRDRFEASHEQAQGHAHALAQQIDRFDRLQARYQSEVETLQRIGQDARDQSQTLKTRFETLESGVQQSLAELKTEQSQAQAQHQRLSDLSRNLQEQVKSQSAELETQVRQAIEQLEKQVTSALDQGRTEMAEQSEQVDQLKRRSESDIEALTEKLRAFQESAQAELAEKSRELFQRQERFESGTQQTITDRFSQIREDLDQQMEKELARIQREFESGQARISDMMALLEAEKAETDEHRRILENEIAGINERLIAKSERFSRQMEKMAQAHRRTIDQGLAESRDRLKSETDQAAALLAELRTRAEALVTDTDARQKRLAEKLRHQNQQELETILSAFKQEKARIAEHLDGLESERNQVGVLQEKLDHAMLLAERKANEKAALFGRQVEHKAKALADQIQTDRETAQAAIGSRWEQLAEQARTDQERIQGFEAEIARFEADIRKQMDAQTHKLDQARKQMESAQKQGLQQGLNQKGQDIQATLQKALSDQLQTRLDARFGQQAEQMETLSEQIAQLGQALKQAQQSLQQQEGVHGQRLEKLRQGMETLYRRQGEQTRGVAGLEERVRALEEALAQKRRSPLFGFANKKKDKPDG